MSTGIHNPVIRPPARRSGRPMAAMVAAFLLLCVVAVLFAVPRMRHDRELLREADAAAGPPLVLTTQVKAGSSDGNLELPGTVQAFQQTPIFARTSGYLKARYVDIGDHVHSGQLLAEIADPQTDQMLRQAQATVVQLKAQLAQAEANAHLSDVTNQRWQTLVKQGVVSQEDADTKKAQAGADAAAVEAAKANIGAGEANVLSLQEQQSFEHVTAPFSGGILSRNVDVGSLISSGSATSVTQMFSIGQADTVRVFTNVPQANAEQVLSGQKASVTFRELPGAIYRGTVNHSTKNIDTDTGTMLVEVDLANSDLKILPGMYANVQFDVRQAHPPVLLPAIALLMRVSGPQAAVVDANNIVHIRSISLGRDMGDAVEVLKGLNDGDRVVLNPADTVTDGAKVQPQLQTQPQQ